MIQSSRRGRCRSHDGFIVVAALWILSALATLASVYSIYVANVATSLAVNDDAIRAEALVHASLELTAYRVTASERGNRPSRGSFAFRLNAADVSVEFCSEAARIDLNSAPKELLAGLFRVLGASDADQHADRIIGWRSAPRSGSQDEVSLYQAIGLGYGPRGAPFAHVGELALVVGLPPALVERAMPHVTVYSGGSKINVRDASAEVISALPGMTPDLLEAVLADRQMLADDSLPQLRSISNAVTTAASKAMRVKVRMSFFSGRAITSEAVILIDDGSEPYRVLSWEMERATKRVRDGPGHPAEGAMSLKRLTDVFWCWIDCVAVSLSNRIDSIRRLRHVRLTEDETNSFKLELVSSGKGPSVVVERIRMAEGRVVGVSSQQPEVALRGSQVELVLRSDRFLLRPLDLPKQAGEFLNGIIRSQLDRLTPWDATHAAFGWSAPADIGNGRIALTVIATARALLSPYIEGLSNLGARLIIVSTIPREAELDDAPIEILRHNGTGATNISIVRHALAAVLVLAALSMGLATTAEQFIASGLDAEKSDIMRRVSERRLAPAGDRLRSALSAQILERRKHETPSSVIVLDALSQILPVHTYATELRLEGDRLQVVGITQDAPSLISLLEQSAHFSRATFFAPTTRSPDATGERFHIEARIRPAFTVQR